MACMPAMSAELDQPSGVLADGPTSTTQDRAHCLPERRPSVLLVPRRRQTCHTPVSHQHVLPVAAAATGSSEPSPVLEARNMTEVLRREIAIAVRQERQARTSGMAELRALVLGLQERLSASVVSGAPKGPGQADCVSCLPECSHSVGAAASAQTSSQLAEELQEERENRCARVAELHARITQEAADLTCGIEQQCAILANEILATHGQLEEQRKSFEKALKQEQEQRNMESQELRAIMDAIWHKAAAPPPECVADKPLQRFFAYAEGGTKEFTGDADDVFTLYDMVREVLSDSAQLQKEIAEEREERQLDIAWVKKRSERLEVRLNAIVRAACAAGPSQPKRHYTLSALAEQDPNWGRLLKDPDHLFCGDDIIDEPYKKYLSDVLAVMMQHACTFKCAVELSSAEGQFLESQRSPVPRCSQEVQDVDACSSQQESDVRVFAAADAAVPSCVAAAQHGDCRVGASSVTETCCDAQQVVAHAG
mmetsp:Transcript_86881/g.202263  ORF Transcript_86881/g.202263 Transcript_86881/m.202263 type:complete len:482 (+) Transcript_86881:36-1481(+)